MQRDDYFSPDGPGGSQPGEMIIDLARSLKAWAALLLPETGRAKESLRVDMRRLLGMDFTQLPIVLLVTEGRRLHIEPPVHRELPNLKKM